MAKSSVQRAMKFSVDRLAYESLKPEQETVVRVFLGGKDVFAAFAYELSTANRCVSLVFHTLLTVSSY